MHRVVRVGIPFGAGRNERPGHHRRIGLPRSHHRKHIGVLIDHDFEERGSFEFHECPECVLEFVRRVDAARELESVSLGSDDKILAVQRLVAPAQASIVKENMMLNTGASWNASVPIAARGTCPLIRTTGTE